MYHKSRRQLLYDCMLITLKIKHALKINRYSDNYWKNAYFWFFDYFVWSSDCNYCSLREQFEFWLHTAPLWWMLTGASNDFWRKILGEQIIMQLY